MLVVKVEFDSEDKIDRASEDAYLHGDEDFVKVTIPENGDGVSSLTIIRNEDNFDTYKAIFRDNQLTVSAEDLVKDGALNTILPFVSAWCVEKREITESLSLSESIRLSESASLSESESASLSVSASISESVSLSAWVSESESLSVSESISASQSAFDRDSESTFKSLSEYTSMLTDEMTQTYSEAVSEYQEFISSSLSAVLSEHLASITTQATSEFYQRQEPKRSEVVFEENLVEVVDSVSVETLDLGLSSTNATSFIEEVNRIIDSQELESNKNSVKVEGVSYSGSMSLDSALAQLNNSVKGKSDEVERTQVLNEVEYDSVWDTSDTDVEVEVGSKRKGLFKRWF